MLTKTRKSRFSATAVVVTIAVFVAFTVFVIVMLANASAMSEEEELRVARENIVRAAVSCYAFEGAYPATLDHLIEHYGLVIDLERFEVYYRRYMDNVMPSIVVAVREVSE
jgi:hypothetical protein